MRKKVSFGRHIASRRSQYGLCLRLHDFLFIIMNQTEGCAQMQITPEVLASSEISPSWCACNLSVKTNIAHDVQLHCSTFIFGNIQQREIF